MDHHNLLYQSLIVSVVVTIALICVLKLFLTTRPPNKKLVVKLPPGPWKLPVIGSMHHLMNVLPHRALRDLAGVHGPLMMLQLGETPLVVVSSKEMARKVLKTHDANFATRPRLLGGDIVLYGWSDIVFSPTGEYWRKLRQLCAAEILGAKRVLTFRHIREQETATSVARIRAAGPSTPVDLSAMLDQLANSIVARASFGNVQSKRNVDKLLSGIRAAAILTSGFMIPDLFPTWRPVLAAVTGLRRALEQVHRTVDTILDEVIKERRGIRGNIKNMRQGEEDDNLVDVLLGLQESGGLGFHLTENSVKAVVFDMFVAGSVSVASSVSWSMSELMRNKRVLSKLQGKIRQAFHGKATVTEADIEAASSRSLAYLKLVIKETLRLHPAVPLLVPRESIEACEIDGYTIPARSRVLVNVWAIGRDPKYWEDDADEFKPERFEDGTVDFNGSSYEFLPFGAGRRICPGIAYTIHVLQIALVQLLYHFDWSLPDGVSELDMAEAQGLGARRKSPLRLCATPFVVSE